MDRLAAQFQELADKFGPQVIDASLGAARMEAYSCLMSGLMWIIVAATLGGLARWLWKLHPNGGDLDGLPQFGGTILFAIAFAALCGGVWSYVDPWTWTAIAHPEMWIAKRVLHL